MFRACFVWNIGPMPAVDHETLYTPDGNLSLVLTYAYHIHLTCAEYIRNYHILCQIQNFMSNMEEDNILL